MGIFNPCRSASRNKSAKGINPTFVLSPNMLGGRDFPGAFRKGAVRNGGSFFLRLPLSSTKQSLGIKHYDFY